MRVLVCGGREFEDKDFVYSKLTAFHHRQEITLLIEGGARGADRLAKQWAIDNKVDFRDCPADWTKYGRSAGAIRNQFMLDHWKPEKVLAFPGNKGTRDMCTRAIKSGIPVKIFVYA